MSHNVAADRSVTRFDEFRPGDEDHQFLLLREMNHRFANSYTALAAMVRKEFGRLKLPGLQQSLDRVEARIVAFAGLHRFLTVGAAAELVSAQCYIERLCEALAESVLKPRGIRCEVSAYPAFMAGECCELMGLVIAELVTNSAKHAFFGRDDGVVRIEFFSTAETWTCIVSDNGVGASATSIGVGSRILEMLLSRLRAEITTKSTPRGTSSMICCPQRHTEAILPGW